jgi:hypothetical protein
MSVCLHSCLIHTKCSLHLVLHRVFSSVACPTLPYFSTLSHKRNDFGEKVIEHEMCVLIFSTNLSETFLILRRIQPDIITNVHRPSCKLPVILAKFLLTFDGSRWIFEKSSNIKFHENPSGGSPNCYRSTDGSTDVTKQTVVIRNFANAP